MSSDAIGWVFRHSPVRGATFTVHLALADSANDQNGYELWMRVRTIASKARLSEGAVRRALAELIEAELLEVLDDGRPHEDAGSATRPRRFVLLLPGSAPEVHSPPRTRRGPAGAARAHSAGSPRTQREARAHDAGTRAHGAGDLQPKGEPKGEPKREPKPPTPTASQLALVAETPPAAGESALDAGFSEFYAAYPRKAAKGDARKAWRQVRRAGTPVATIVAGAARYAADPNRVDRYTKLPASWLRAECWDDPPLPSRGGGGRSSSRPGRPDDDMLQRHRELLETDPFFAETGQAVAGA